MGAADLVGVVFGSPFTLLGHVFLGVRGLFVGTSWLFEGLANVFGVYIKGRGEKEFNGRILVFSERTVKDMNSYKATWGDYATKIQAAESGVRANFSFQKILRDEDGNCTDAANAVVQFAWYDSPEDMLKCMAAEKAAVGSEYAAGSDETDYVQVFGDWNEDVKTAAEGTGIRYSFDLAQPDKFGMARKDGQGFLYDNGPPMIWVSKRRSKPGLYMAYLRQWQKAAEYQFNVAPGLIASTEKADQFENDMGWSIRVFNDYDKGFTKHAMGAFPWLLYQLLGPTLPKLAPPFPLGIAFCRQEDLDGAIGINPGNKSYVPYHWEKVIGPMPDFKKGMVPPTGCLNNV